jgi:hypothetical protein
MSFLPFVMDQREKQRYSARLENLKLEMPVRASNLSAVQFVSLYYQARKRGSREFLGNAPYILRSRRTASAWLAHAHENLGRFLLALATIELLSMPLTQYAWTWDHFLHGGMDFESSLLFLVVCLGLVLVLRHHCQENEMLRVLSWRMSLPDRYSTQSSQTPGAGTFLAFHRERRACFDLSPYGLPLQI